VPTICTRAVLRWARSISRNFRLAASSSSCQAHDLDNCGSQLKALTQLEPRDGMPKL
jgi:hypothetical protein